MSKSRRQIQSLILYFFHTSRISISVRTADKTTGKAVLCAKLLPVPTLCLLYNGKYTLCLLYNGKYTLYLLYNGKYTLYGM